MVSLSGYYISLENVDNGLLKSYSTILFGESPSRARRVVSKDDILIGTVRPNLKSHFWFKLNAKDYVCSTGFSVLSVKNNFSAGYIFNHFFSYIVNKQIDKLISGSNYPAISSSDVKNLLLPLPPTLAEQEKIATALSDTDSYIEKLEKLIEKKKYIKTGAMQELLTGKKRLPGFGKGKGTRETEVGVIPEDWEVKKLGEVVGKITTGKLDANAMNEEGRYPFFTCARKVYKIDFYAFDDEAILVSGNGANVGYVHYYLGKFNAYQRTYVILDFRLSPIFCKIAIQNNIKKRINEEVNAGNTPYILKSTLSEMNLFIPSYLAEQEKIAEVLSDMDSEIEKLEVKLDKYKNIKQGMMQKLLTGEIRLV
jgi:type I restriction enzyme S subunit